MNEDAPVNVTGGVAQTETPIGSEPARRKPKSFKEFAAEQTAKVEEDKEATE